jgi:hypothetical protein
MNNLLNTRLIILSFISGASTWCGVGLLETYMPYSEMKIRLIDFLSLPGGLAAAVFFPSGIHTGNGAPAFLYFTVAFNFLIYSAFWYAMILLVSRYMTRKRPNA